MITAVTTRGICGRNSSGTVAFITFQRTSRPCAREKLPSVPRGYLHLLRRYVGPRWPRAVLLAVLLLSSIGLQLVGPQLLRGFIDGAIGAVPVEQLSRLALAFVVVALLTQVLTASAQYVGEDLGWSATNALRADLALHLLRLDMTFHKARTPGELIERVDGDVTSLAVFFSRFVVNVFGNLLLLLGVLIVVAYVDLRAGLASSASASRAPKTSARAAQRPTSWTASRCTIARCSRRGAARSSPGRSSGRRRS